MNYDQLLKKNVCHVISRSVITKYVGIASVKMICEFETWGFRSSLRLPKISPWLNNENYRHSEELDESCFRVEAIKDKSKYLNGSVTDEWMMSGLELR
jgi:hypothetical protein